jgi:hypothetical protein
MSSTFQGVVSDNGLAEAPADLNPPDDQTSGVLVSRDGQVGVRFCDAAGFPEGEERYTQHHEALVNPAFLVDQILVSDRTCRLTEAVGYANGLAIQTDFFYLGFYDSAKALAGGETPVLEFPVSQNRGSFSIGYEHRFETGLVVALSTAQGTFTAGATVMFAAVKVLRD